MKDQNHLNRFKKAVVQISTPGGVGTGFYVASHQLIVTNEHVVSGYAEAVVSFGANRTTVSHVLYYDPAYDLAFLEAPDQLDEVVNLSPVSAAEGDFVMTMGHPHGLKFTSSRGVVTKARRQHNDLDYIQFDATINPGNSGGPLINASGDVIGVNSFMVRGSKNMGFALPVGYLNEVLDEYATISPEVGYCCPSCRNISRPVEVVDDHCGHCGTALNIPDELAQRPLGSALVIEKVMASLEIDVALARRGRHSWCLNSGDTEVRIGYSEYSGFITGDAQLAVLPRQGIERLYRFLLTENSRLTDLFFSVDRQTIMLSFIVFDQYLDGETSRDTLRHLLDRADDYRRMLIERFGAREKKTES